MKFRFTEHAKYRLFVERKISAEAIKAVIQNPDSRKSLPGGLVKCVKNISKSELVVVFSKDKNVYVIITAYFKD
ncbi:MAG: DUF4258 domain-containing protein [bacterium]|nr:DUF4258 domain-containing protein [bacterium]